MNRIFRRSYIMYVFAIAFLFGLILLFFTMGVNSDDWVVKEYNKHLYSKGELIAAGTITDRYGVILAQTVDGERKFAEDKKVREATLHVVGDTGGFIATGVHSAMKSNLTGYSLLNGVYKLKRDGAGNDVQLSIDSRLCVTAMEALGNYQGTIGVYNYKTGEIYCAVSLPTYDVYNKPEDIATDKTDKYDGIYLNRFFSGVYTPGSTFKIVTACSAIENIIDINQRYFTCNGAWYNKAGSVVKCNGVHGTVNFDQALQQSCNSAFAAIAAELGNENMQKTAEECGFNSRVMVDNIRCATSRYNVKDAAQIDRAWSGIGQYTTLANPCHMVTLMGAIANRSGFTPAPTLIKGKTTSKIDYMGSVPAKRLDDMLRANVEGYYGDNHFPNLQMCGKTGTAQVADDKPHTWFVGYSQRADMPLAIVVVCENSGDYGINIALPIAGTVMQKAYELYVLAYADLGSEG